MKFKLNPNETAAENLWRACSMATDVILRKKPIYRSLDGETLYELRENIKMKTYENFLYHKVMLHKYTTVAKNGKPLDFFDNVLSCCWSISFNEIDRMCREMTRRSHTATSSSVGEFDSMMNSVFMPKYISRHELRQRKNALAEEYNYYLDDCEEFGIEPISIEEWLERNQ